MIPLHKYAYSYLDSWNLAQEHSIACSVLLDFEWR